MTRLPLEGVKVLDLGWVAAGPQTTRYLADFGATVVRLESQARVDTVRVSPPYRDAVPGVNRSGSFANWNANKQSVSINMGTTDGIALARRIILEWADVVTENFTAGVMERWGLGYESLRIERPDLIMLSLSTFGQRNALSEQPGYGPLLTPFVGINHLTGWPDRAPAIPGPFGGYVDFIIPRMAVLAVVAALDHRARGGKGLHLDLAQYIASLQLVSPLLMAWAANGEEAVRVGNRDPAAVPHGVYPCRGPDQWIAIGVTDDDQWAALRRAMGSPAWCKSRRFQTLTGRKAHEAEIDALLARWTAQHPARELARNLQDAGVPAAPVNSSRDLTEDPQLSSRGLYAWVEHAEIGRHRIETPEIHLSGTPFQIRTPAPLMGEHSYAFLHEVLGLSAEEIAVLMEKEVVY